MNPMTLAPATAGAGALPAPVTAAELLAGAITPPTQLPPKPNRRTGALEPMRHLSVSSLNLFQGCPEAWRRRYLLGETDAATPAMIIGNAADDTLTVLFEARVGGSDIDADTLLGDVFEGVWQRTLAERAPIAFGHDGLDEKLSRQRAHEATRVALTDLAPRLGRPTAVQRRFDLPLVAGASWTLNGYVDLDTVRTQIVFVDDAGREICVQDEGEPEPLLRVEGPPRKIQFTNPQTKRKNTRYERPDGLPAGALYTPVERTVTGVVDHKVKAKPIGQSKADHDLQATLYLAERAWAGQPAHDFRFSQIHRDNQTVSGSIVATRRSDEQLRAALVRFAKAAEDIHALYEAYGRDRPWPFAAPDHWRCSARFCRAFRERTCPAAAL